MSPVVVYFYSNEWIPMKCFSLGEAIALYRKASLLGKKIIVYPAYLDPYINRSAAPPCASEEEELQRYRTLDRFSQNYPTSQRHWVDCIDA